jgi:hypothetical protein
MDPLNIIDTPQRLDHADNSLADEALNKIIQFNVPAIYLQLRPDRQLLICSVGRHLQHLHLSSNTPHGNTPFPEIPC